MLLRKIRMPDAIQIRQTGGPEVLNWTPIEVGERVAYAGPIGGYSEVRLIHADRPVKLPEAIAFDQAAAMIIATVPTEAKAELARARGCRHTILHTKQEAPNALEARAASGSSILTIQPGIQGSLP